MYCQPRKANSIQSASNRVIAAPAACAIYSKSFKKYLR